ncbi:hypothetical protein [Cellulosilyticum ruminicola]|uniref:hypothetical protein n=1 Tax=Cellulosilyticum ruminicola TaxID=425254 RepID=UPI0006CF708B|nr:hypothetical protein [Cellulosilyticum ruminicola]
MKRGITLRIVAIVTIVIIAICTALSYVNSNKLIKNAYIAQMHSDLNFIKEMVNNLMEKGEINVALIEGHPFKEKMYEMIQMVADMAKDTSKSTDEMSAYIEEQVATMNDIVDMLKVSVDTAQVLNKEME